MTKYSPSTAGKGGRRTRRRRLTRRKNARQ
jgi:hypothetical protein